jgi:tricorn protease
MKKLALLLSLMVLSVPAWAQSSSSGPLLLRTPTVSRTQIAFSYAGDIWVAPRSGGDARRVTAGEGSATRPTFSPDGSLIAYTATVDGNTDVYTMPATGGVAKRLT